MTTFSLRSDDLFGAATMCQWCRGLIVAQTRKRVAGGMLTHLPPRLENKPSRMGGHRPSGDQTGIIKSNTCLLNFSTYAQRKPDRPFPSFFKILAVLDWGMALC